MASDRPSDATVRLARTDDIVRGTYRLRLDVEKPVDFSRFVIFQIGADTYSYTGERKMAVGNETGLVREWPAQWGGDTYRTDPLECLGRVPWISLHDAVSRAKKEAAARGRQGAPGAWANRGIVIRSWQAQLGGKPAAPWFAEHGVKARGEDTSTAEILPPTGVTRLEPGDFVEATIEHLVVPQYAGDYYGPSEALRAALGQWENTWRMIHREAIGNDRRVAGPDPGGARPRACAGWPQAGDRGQRRGARQAVRVLGDAAPAQVRWLAHPLVVRPWHECICIRQESDSTGRTGHREIDELDCRLQDDARPEWQRCPDRAA